ncbi:MAG: ATP-binding protein [Acidobacteria bacterium]|nr:ATP-binding protein [Acidobacteriota bacterium]
MNKEKKEINLPSRLKSIDKAVVEATDFASRAGFSEEALYAINMAMRESVANAVKHGNQLDETKQVEITLKNSSEGLEITIRDFGEGFAVEEIPDPTNPENLMKADGRGILFMKTFMDEVKWSNHARGGMIVKMLKRR